MEYVILLDRKFPYLAGESFLENEIAVLAEAFDRILIYPSDVCRDEKKNRSIANANVEARPFETKSLRKRKVRYVLAAPKYFIKSREKNPIHRFLDAYFEAAAQEQAKKIIADLESLKLSGEDHIYVYSYWLYVSAKAALLIREYLQKKGIPVKVFSRAHRFDIYEEKRRFAFLPKRRELLDGLDQVFVVSDNGKNYLKEHYPKYADKISAAYLGTYDHGLGKINDEETFRIVSCSRVTDVKRVDQIVEALALLKDDHLKLCWTHIGDGTLFEDLKKKAGKLDWMEVCMDGAIPNTAVYDHYRENPEDLFINVSSTEGLPVSIMEATSFGIPVIGTDVGGTGEIVVDEVSGKLIPADFTAEELAAEIRGFATMDRDDYLALRQSTRSLWEHYYQAPKNYRKFVQDIKNMESRV